MQLVLWGAPATWLKPSSLCVLWTHRKLTSPFIRADIEAEPPSVSPGVSSPRLEPAERGDRKLNEPADSSSCWCPSVYRGSLRSSAGLQVDTDNSPLYPETSLVFHSSLWSVLVTAELAHPLVDPEEVPEPIVSGPLSSVRGAQHSSAFTWGQNDLFWEDRNCLPVTLTKASCQRL